ncbi:uncharacterized protein (DUF2336 family) [Methylobacterium sp. BE186]|uniref:DUF2336 domain-containing protein n=1 Tax=Methylobacterium sp. BE186 TaxID=2817715 RepID=UPI0028663806|nr:DUF2336 domain-containing protein [Methylobacterium sp. BE186]MDR7038372.1 uncharacterized protein (DUF2336 family) [Methylobacterium sp. BE186]
MMIRQFLAWTQHDSAGRRAEAASALARAYLYGNLGPDAAWEAKTAILALLDDASPLVRRALAEACAASARAPRPLVVTLAADQPEIASLVLARSPILTDADLVDAAAMGCEAVRCVIAGRHHLTHAVAGALAEIGGPETLARLAANPTARITTGRLLRMVARHGDDATLREALLARADLPLEVRHAVAGRLAETLSGFVTACGWLSPERGERMTREARERALLDLCAGAGAAALARVVQHLRASGQLNAGLVLRAVLSGQMAFAETALADLAGLDRARVAGLVRSARGYGGLHLRAGLPEALLPAFSAALSAWREAETGATSLSGAGLSRRMIERALTACEDMPFSEMQAVTALLARYEAEAARDEARAVARAIAEQAEAREAARLEAARVEAEWQEAQARVSEARVSEARVSEASVSETRATHAEAVDPAAIAPLPEPARVTADTIEIRAALGAEPVAAASGDDLIPAEAASAAALPEAVSAILDALPDAILSSFREEQARTAEARDRETAEAAAEAVLETIPAALIASYREDRARMKLAA